MDVINVRGLGLAFGSTAAILYLGCALILHSLGTEKAITFFNSLMHGIDVTSIIKTDMSLGTMIIGIIQVFILGWLTGASIASIYNYAGGKR